ncbi:hypothetical protein PQU92_08165 [Asticcacaulis sp. BYS171W]|uniref:Uncharacterized protein n=1 Tax=Asticcacaulis aquaticus TaxID=2984212 RepID=A0ABT5HT53_9CAUL|nr:hypothetical protein [Asticcacaulis aquaticus]MDC7683248.1 hypothetical protein [Asticcacaulis aquaticus]
MSDHVLIKRDLFWRPNGQGYTGVLREAGRYERESVLKMGYPIAQAYNDAPAEITYALPIDLAPEFTNACCVYVQRDELLRQRKERDEHPYTIGEETGLRVFSATGLTNLSDMQAVLDQVEKALAPLPLLAAALSGLLPEVDSEIEQRQTSGNDEYWQGLDDLSAKAHAALAMVRVA